MVQNLCIFRVCAKYVKSIFGRNSGLRNSMRTSGKCFEREIDYFGNDITSYTASSPEQCQIKCQGDSLCKAWTFNGRNKNCFLKSSNSGKTASASYVTSGPKNCIDGVTPRIPNHDLMKTKAEAKASMIRSGKPELMIFIVIMLDFSMKIQTFC